MIIFSGLDLAMFWISAAKTIPRQHTALPSSTIIGVQSCQKSINPDQCEPAVGERMAAASAKTDYSPAVPDPSTLVGPGGVEHHIVRVRGLPWSCTENELIEFFEGVCIQSVHFTRDRDGRPSGDAYMVLASLKDQKLAHKFHKAHMGNRYLEVFEARYSEMSWMLSKNIDKDPKDAAEFEEFEPESDAVVKMRGLPFEAGPAEIVRFFEGLAVAEKGVLICKDSNRRPSGEGYCVFVDEEAVAEALKRDNASMGHSYSSYSHSCYV